jgi:hypothetical protein
VRVVVTSSSAIVPADQFTYRPPVVTGLVPNNGPEGGNTPITISGTDFDGAWDIYFGTVRSTSPVNCTSTSCTATSPPGFGVVDVRVVVTSSSAIVPADQFTYRP